jgi:hypothetical protein
MCARDDMTRRVAPRVQLRLHPQVSRPARVADQVDHGLKGAEGTAAPVLRDVTRQAVLDLVPPAGAWWKCETWIGRRRSSPRRCSSSFHVREQ